MLSNQYKGTILILVVIFALFGCNENESSTEVNCRSTYTDPFSEIDSLSQVAIEAALTATFVRSNLLLRRTNQVFLEESELNDSGIEWLFGEYKFKEVLAVHDNLINWVNINNDGKELQYGSIQDYPWEISLSEWMCLLDNYQDKKSLYDGLLDFSGLDYAGGVFDASLPGYTNDSTYAMVVSFVTWLNPSEYRGKMEKRYILLELDSVGSTPKMIATARKWTN